ncbi:MAG: hypothetical protein LBD97_07685, partial [Bifidobacteriaceae bacterium]|nr:hypothetical protein [Bifidobacteriaceae bacterium]
MTTTPEPASGLLTSEIIDGWTGDPGLSQPYIDIDDPRESPVRHRYVHGGFRDSATRFSFYYPPADQYQGRFFQHFTPAPDSENLAQSETGQNDKITLSATSGAYFVETNGGGPWAVPGGDVDPLVGAYKANAAAARVSRVLAQRLYGEHRPFGYAYGGSGGGYRTVGAAENTTGVWDGFVPFVLGSPYAVPNMFSVRMLAQRVLRDKLDGIVDALEPGGSGEPETGLTGEELAVWREVTAMGFPTRAWFNHRQMGTQSFGMLLPVVRALDPAYFADYWTVPGYEGADPTSSASRARVRFRTVVAQVRSRADDGRNDNYSTGRVEDAFSGRQIPMSVSSLKLAEPLEHGIDNAELKVLTGSAAGTVASLASVAGDIAKVDFPELSPELVKLRPGDEVVIDNSDFLAVQTYHRHQVPPDAPVWDYFKSADGVPRYQQRPELLGPKIAASASGTVQSGRFAGKMIVVASLLDREAFPWQADWYANLVRRHLGDAVDDRFRIWYTDNALHGELDPNFDPTHTVRYLGCLHQALRDLAAWVEDGTAPPRSTTYAVSGGQVSVPATAAQRGGIQPVVTCEPEGGAPGHSRTVGAGEPVRLRAVAVAPPG